MLEKTKIYLYRQKQYLKFNNNAGGYFVCTFVKFILIILIEKRKYLCVLVGIRYTNIFLSFIYNSIYIGLLFGEENFLVFHEKDLIPSNFVVIQKQ